MLQGQEKILLVDDEPHIIKLFEKIAENESYDIIGVSHAQKAIELLSKQSFNLIISDLILPEISGIDFLKYAKSHYPTLPFIIITGFASISTAREAIMEGAFHYLTKPFSLNELKAYIDKALEFGRIHTELKELREKLDILAPKDKLNIIGNHHKFLECLNLVNISAPSEANILITGESGTGKELLAQLIHNKSYVNDKKFIIINCAGIPKTLLESELFGHTKGAFTGAFKDRIGLFQEAEGGTILLDEVGELPPELQLKLLRVIQEKTIKPIGSNKTVKIDARLIFATNKDLNDEVKKGKFRLDLYYRIAVITIHLPPLRERKDDIPLLAYYFLDKFSKLNKKNIKQINENTLNILMCYKWPGNIRELQNIIESSVILCDKNVIEPYHLPLHLRNFQLPIFMNDDFYKHIDFKDGFSLKTVLNNTEADIINKALHFYNFNKKKVAEILKISRTSLFEKIKKYNLKNKG